MGIEETRSAPDAATRRSRRARYIAVVTAVVAAAGLVAALLVGTADSASGRLSAPPWPVPSDPVTRAKAAGLRMLTAEGTVLHIHQHLTITVDGTSVTVPARIGILVVDGREKSFSFIHTHDTSGVLHVESPVRKRFFLGQVFTEWDFRLAPGRVGSYRDGENGVRLSLFVDRKRYAGDPRKLVLASRQDIDFVITTTGTTPQAPGAAYSFPSNY